MLFLNLSGTPRFLEHYDFVPFVVRCAFSSAGAHLEYFCSVGAHWPILAMCPIGTHTALANGRLHDPVEVFLLSQKKDENG